MRASFYHEIHNRMKKEAFFGFAMLTMAGCTTTNRQTAALLDEPRLELESLKPEKATAPRRIINNSNHTRSRLIADGKKLIGTRYRYGGTSEKTGFDCSGLVQHVFAQQGYRLPRSSNEQFSKLLPVKEPRPGDLIFFRHGKGKVNHVGIYLGNQKMLHSPSPGKKVEITRIDQAYWQKRYAGARAVVQERVTVSR